MSTDKKILEKRLTYMTLTGIFMTLFAVINLFTRRQKSELRPFDFVLLALAAFRLGRLSAYDIVTSPFRAPFTQTVPDGTGAGESVEPKGEGWQWAVGELLCCPICSGTWIAALLVYALELAPRPGRMFITIMGAMGLGEVFNALVEALSWGGQLAREKAGVYAKARAVSTEIDSF